MKVIIFGATGRVGGHLVEQALENGHTVTAFVRDRKKLEVSNENLHLFEGDVMDPATVETAVSGHDAVLCALGDGRRGKVRAKGTKNIIDGMENTGVRRLICQTTIGAGDSYGNLNFV